MCQFDLLIIDKGMKWEDLKNSLIENGLGFQELHNQSLINQLEQNKRVILTTKNHCDCGSILGINHQGQSIKTGLEKVRKKLRKNEVVRSVD